MTKDKLVFINGRAYDGITGMPMSDTKNNSTMSQKNVGKMSDFKVSPKIKTKTISSKTLPKPVTKNSSPRVMDIVRSKSISHFATDKISNAKKISNVNNSKKALDIGPIKHPLATKVHKILKNDIKKSPKDKTSKEIKENAIKEALAKQPINSSAVKKNINPKQKLAILIIAGILLVAGLSYGAYLYLPSLSVKIASAQAGINARYPEYKPDGYKINGPVSYSDKEVVINFKANAGENKYSIKQTESYWDSSALRQKVEQESNGNFATTSVNGLTIYTYDHTSMWVSGGILFTIVGDADLLSDQIHRIAVSL